MIDYILTLYLNGIYTSLLFGFIYILLEAIIGRVIMIKSKQVWLGIIFYTIISWLGVIIYIYCISTVFKGIGKNDNRYKKIIRSFKTKQ